MANRPKKPRNTSDCVDCGGIVAPSAESCPHCGSTDFTGSKRETEVKSKEEKAERAEKVGKEKVECEKLLATEGPWDRFKKSDGPMVFCIILVLCNGFLLTTIREVWGYLGKMPEGKYRGWDGTLTTDIAFSWSRIFDLEDGFWHSIMCGFYVFAAYWIVGIAHGIFGLIFENILTATFPSHIIAFKRIQIFLTTLVALHLFYFGICLCRALWFGLEMPWYW